MRTWHNHIVKAEVYDFDIAIRCSQVTGLKHTVLPSGKILLLDYPNKGDENNENKKNK